MPAKSNKDFLTMTPAEQEEAIRNMSPSELEGLRRSGKAMQAAMGNSKINEALTRFDDNGVKERAAAEKQQYADTSAAQAKAGKTAAAEQAANKQRIDFSNGAGVTSAPRGLDQTNQGVGEQLWGLHEKDFFAPGDAKQFTDRNAATYEQAGFGEQGARTAADRLDQGGAGAKYWEGVQGKYNQGGPKYVQDAYGSFDADVDPNLGGFYDHAFNQAAGGINKQLAARGQYGSSSGMQQIGNAAVGLNAERANREAAYGLQRFNTKMGAAGQASGDERAWVQGLGDLAFRAGEENRSYINDSAGQAASAQAQEFARLGAGHDQAASNDAFASSNRNAGFDAAFKAQGARDDRIQRGFDNQIGFGQILAAMGSARANANYTGATAEAEAGLAGVTDAENATNASNAADYQRYLQVYDSSARAASSYAPVAPKAPTRDPKKVT